MRPHATRSRGRLAQLEERRPYKAKVGGSSPSAPTETATTVALDLEGVLFALGEGQRFRTMVAGLKEELGSDPSMSLAKILASEANWMAGNGDFEGAARRAGDSIRMAETLQGDPPPRALAIRGESRVSLGDLQGVADVRLAVDGYLRTGEAHHASMPLHNLGSAMSKRGPAVGLPYIEEAIVLAERFGVDTTAWAHRAARLEGLAELGRFDEIVESVASILEWAAEHQDAYSRFAALASLAFVEIDRGEPDIDPQQLAELSRRLDFEAALVLAAQLVLDQGDAELARSLLLEGIAHVDPEYAFTAARTCIEAGLPELVEALLSKRVVKGPADEAARLATQAVLAESGGHPQAARDDYTMAAGMFEALEMTPAQAHASQGLGRCLLALGENDYGEAKLKETRALWEQMKATRRIAEIDRLLAGASTSEGGSA